MTDWPQCETNITQDKTTKKYKAVAKTKLPCGITQVEIVESVDAKIAKSQAVVACTRAGRLHIIAHGCNIT